MLGHPIVFVKLNQRCLLLAQVMLVRSCEPRIFWRRLGTSQFGRARASVRQFCDGFSITVASDF